MSETKSDFNVLEMAKDYADSNNMDVGDLFAKKEKSEIPNSLESESSNDEGNVDEIPANNKTISGVKKGPWVPDKELLDGMDELTSGPVTYAKEDIKTEEDNENLKNIVDETAIQESRESMDDLQRKYYNIEEAKKRHGIVKFKIPEGETQVYILAAAGDTNHQRSQSKLDEIFNEIKITHPEYIYEWAEDAPSVINGKFDPEETAKRSEAKKAGEDLPPLKSNNYEGRPVSEEGTDPLDDLQIIIDKRNLSQIAWSEEDLEKIKKSRTIELNIVENVDLDYSQIENVEENMIDTILAPYQRTVNDVTASLPASKYRATFTGLSYPEVLDLSNSNEMNNIDGERKKWSICFNHMKNQSIGPWEEYQWYIDPETGNKVTATIGTAIPNNINPNDVHIHSKFEDFLRKTSFMDLEFMLWKILCATAMDKEIISIDCHAMHNGTPCNKNYDWVYSPSELLQIDTIDPIILEEMKKTAEVVSKEDIIANYNTSMLKTNNTVKLPVSGYTVVFGHISAYDYLDSVYAEIEALREMDANDPTLASRGIIYVLLSAIKAFLIPKPDGNGYYRITGARNLVKVIDSLHEVDWETISELVKLMLDPYQFQYALKDIVCPQCKNKSTIPIDSMTKLLFIIARSLNSVNVTLKKI